MYYYATDTVGVPRIMLVFRPEEVLGTYRGFKVVLVSEKDTEDIQDFKSAVFLFKSLIKSDHWKPNEDN